MTDRGATWSAGAALMPFPVARGTPLGGYAARTGFAVETLDPLTIGALVLEREGRRLVIVAADVIAVDAALVDEIAVAAALDRGELALCASHTHSGPAGIVSRLHPADPDRLDPALRSRFVETAANAIAIAQSAMETVGLLSGVADTHGVAANRNDIAGAYDPRLSVLATRRRDGSLQAVVVHFACHPTILGAENLGVSADFPGALRRALRNSLGQDGRAPVVLFINGAAGDVSTRFTRRAQDVEEVERVGNALAVAAMDAIGQARPLAGSIEHIQTTIALPPRQRPDDVAVAVHPRSNDETASHTLSAGQRRIVETKAQGASMLAALSSLPDAAIPAELRQDAWALGELTLVAIPGELFASLGLQIGAVRPDKTLILGYTNGYGGYLADRPAYEKDTYEALASQFAPGAGENVADAALALVSRLYG